MYQPLAPCPACSRHIKTSERTCPFCKGTVSEEIASAAIPGASTRLTRAAMFAFSTSLAVAGVAAGGAGCSSGTASTVGDAAADGKVDDGGGVDAAYGGPPIKDSAPDDDGSAMALYGLPADSGAD